VISNTDLKRIRLELGFTQRKMATMIGYSYYNYRNIEQGQRKMTKEFELSLKEFLEVWIFFMPIKMVINQV